MKITTILLGGAAMLIIVLLTSILTIWGYSTFIQKERALVQQSGVVTDTEKADFAGQKETPDGEKVQFIEVDNIVVTLKGEGRKERYMQLELALTAYGDEEVKQSQAITPVIRSAILSVLSNRNYTEVRAMTVNELHDLLLKAAKETLSKLNSKVRFHDLIISKLIFQ